MPKLLKPNGIIISNARLSLTARKLWNFLIFKARNKIKSHSVFEVSFSELYTFMGWTGRNTPYVKTQIQQLVNTSIERTPINKRHKWVITPLLSTVKFYDTYMEYEFTPYMQNKFIIQENYSLIDLTVSTSMSSYAKMAFYEWLEEYKNIKATPFLAVRQYIQLCGVEDKKAYKDWKEFNRSIVKPVLEDFRYKLGYVITIEYKREAGFVTHARFLFRKASLKERVKDSLDHVDSRPLI